MLLANGDWSGLKTKNSYFSREYSFMERKIYEKSGLIRFLHRALQFWTTLVNSWLWFERSAIYSKEIQLKKEHFIHRRIQGGWILRVSSPTSTLGRHQYQLYTRTRTRSETKRVTIVCCWLLLSAGWVANTCLYTYLTYSEVTLFAPVTEQNVLIERIDLQRSTPRAYICVDQYTMIIILY